MKKTTKIALTVGALLLVVIATPVLAQQIDPPEREEEAYGDAAPLDAATLERLGLSAKLDQDAAIDTWAAPAPDLTEAKLGDDKAIVDVAQEPFLMDTGEDIAAYQGEAPEFPAPAELAPGYESTDNRESTSTAGD